MRSYCIVSFIKYGIWRHTEIMEVGFVAIHLQARQTKLSLACCLPEGEGKAQNRGSLKISRRKRHGWYLLVPILSTQVIGEQSFAVGWFFVGFHSWHTKQYHKFLAYLPQQLQSLGSRHAMTSTDGTSYQVCGWDWALMRLSPLCDSTESPDRFIDTA